MSLCRTTPSYDFSALVFATFAFPLGDFFGLRTRMLFSNHFRVRENLLVQHRDPSRLVVPP